jgi:hypothetical protein
MFNNCFIKLFLILLHEIDLMNFNFNINLFPKQSKRNECKQTVDVCAIKFNRIMILTLI